ncbi:hypothetical protein [Methylorubrum populi]
MSGTDTFDLTLERIALIRRMVVAWDGTEPGAPMIHPTAPYGSTDRDGDIFNVTGDDEGADEEHRAMGGALAVFLHNAVLKPGRYQYHNPLAKLDPAESLDVFRDEATGETPEHITFEVTEAHLRLMPHLNLAWDEAREVPVIDPQRPYGASDAYTAEMATHLGAVAGAGDDLKRLHREMQPALQIFLRYGDLGPDLFHRSGRGWQAA